MSFYLVRVKKSKEAVGILYASNKDSLFSLVDELVDPNDCEYKPAPDGGIFFKLKCPNYPLESPKWDDTEEGEIAAEKLMESQNMTRFVDAMTEELDDAQYEDKGWKELDFGSLIDIYQRFKVQKDE